MSDEEEDNTSTEAEEVDDSLFIAKDGTQWNKIPPKRSRLSRQNIVTTKQGLTHQTQSVASIAESFKFFINDEIIDTIVAYTNQKAEQIFREHNEKHPDKNKTWIPTNPTEVYAVLGVLITMGALKAKREPLSFLWSKDALYTRPIFPAAISRDRMKHLLSFIRFDDMETRTERRKTDKLAACRQIFDIFVKNCNYNYNPGTHLTVDEQLLGFRGKCPFRIYMKSKPAKYGIKIWALVDVATTYVKNLQVYLGKTADKPEKEQGKRVVLDMVSCLGQGYGITTDNFFTSVPLAHELLDRGLTLCGTLRQNKREIPSVLMPNRNREEKSSVFAFTKKITLASYVPKKGKAVIVLSSEHHDDKVGNETDDYKPHIIQHYNETKGSVDTMDKMVNEYSVKRATKRWPFVLFQNMLDIAALNGFILWTTKNPELRSDCKYRRQYLLELGRELIKPNAKERLKNKYLPRRVAEAIKILIPEEVHENLNIEEQATTSSASRRCTICPRKHDKKTRRICQQCKSYVCSSHSLIKKSVLCTKCNDKNE